MTTRPLDKRLERQIWALEAYANAATVLGYSNSFEELANGVCSGITNQYPYVVSWVGLAQEDESKSVLVIGASGPAKAYTEGIEVSWDVSKPSGQGPIGRTIRTGQTQVVNDALEDPYFSPWRERAQTYQIASYVSVPIIQDISIVGALVVYASVKNAFDVTEIKLFENLGREIGYGLSALKKQQQLEIEKKELNETQLRLVHSLEMIISAMATTMEMRDPYTSGHQRKVALIAEALANEMGWDQNEIQGLKMAAQIHDIGKVSIPSELLTKPSCLTNIEYALMKEHANNGYLILKDIPFDWPIAETVRQHHERIDGSGYPRGLKGDEILPGARILAVADTIDSMASHRPYRAALGLDLAMQEIVNESGVKLDKDVVEAAKILHKNKILDALLNSKI